MSILFDTYSDDLYKVHGFEWDKSLKGYSHLYFLDKDCHLEVVFLSNKADIGVFDSEGQNIVKESVNIKGLSQKSGFEKVDKEVENILKREGLL